MVSAFLFHLLVEPRAVLGTLAVHVMPFVWVPVVGECAARAGGTASSARVGWYLLLMRDEGQVAVLDVHDDPLARVDLAIQQPA